MTNCVSYSYDSNVTIAVPSRTNSSQIIVITDPRVHIPQCKHAGQAIYGITYFLIVVDVLCIISVSTASCCPVVTNTYEDTSVFCFFLKYVRYLSLIGGLLLLGLNLVIWGIACHLQVRSVASNARLSAGFFLTAVGLVLRIPACTKYMRKWRFIDGEFTYREIGALE
eukprot:TRINITY_DN403_c0_g1_i1.p1 TRINITY_DN403_c0_g1~~TRINITY_DN403_c0_g1_i1.p1  ORF type:complete len:168 (-),score=24.67 TRINITY_DN403_c0_g1_i1:97-600(-)